MTNAMLHSSFSWSRVLDFARMFRRPIGVQMLIYACTFIAFTSVIMLVGVKSSFFYPLSLIFGCATSLMIFLIPLPLRWARSTQAILYPASMAEKFTFIAGYSLLICPLAILVLSGLYYLVGSLCYQTNFYALSVLNMRTYNASAFTPTAIELINNPATMLSAWFSGLAWNALIVIVALAVVLFQKRHAAVKCILAPLGISLGLGFICGIGGIVAAISGFDRELNNPAFMIELMTRYLALLSVLLIAVEAFIVWRIYRHYSRMNIC